MPSSDPSPESRRAAAAKVSDILQGLTIGRPEERLTFGALRQEFGERAFGVLLLIFTLPNCLPMPGIPGVSLITGLPVVFFAFQLAIGQDRPYLPKWLRERSFTRGQLAHVMVKAGPHLRRLERLVRPRLTMIAAGIGERVLAVVILAVAVALCLPIPFGNLLPGFALLLLSLSLIERDGLLTIIGYGMSALAAIWLLLLFAGAEELVKAIFHLG